MDLGKLILALGWAITISRLGMSNGKVVLPEVVERFLTKPLLVHGCPGDFDALKVGPRVVLKRDQLIIRCGMKA
jgi:hypothetical protein